MLHIFELKQKKKLHFKINLISEKNRKQFYPPAKPVFDKCVPPQNSTE